MDNKKVKEEEVLYLIIPAYNEESNIKNVIDEWYPIVEKMNGGGYSRLVIIDDGSKDATYCIAKEEALSRPFLLPLTKRNEGHGAAILFGYRYALEHGADYIFQTDSDGQTCPSDFFLFWENKKKYDMVIGYRNKRQDGILRLFVTKVLRGIIYIFFNVWVKDANTPFRLMKSQSLKENILYIPEKFNLSNVIISVVYLKRNQNVKFIPINFRPRQGGENSINMKKIVKIGFQSLHDFYVINKRLEEVLK